MILKKEIIEQLSKELLLPYTGIEQDWDIEMADSKRIDEFIDFYCHKDLSVDKRIAVISLILSSYEDFLSENDLKVDHRWNTIRFILESERDICFDLIEHWSFSNEIENNDEFRITSLIKDIKI